MQVSDYCKQIAEKLFSTMPHSIKKSYHFGRPNVRIAMLRAQKDLEDQSKDNLEEIDHVLCEKSKEFMKRGGLE